MKVLLGKISSYVWGYFCHRCSGFVQTSAQDLHINKQIQTEEMQENSKPHSLTQVTVFPYIFDTIPEQMDDLPY